MKKNWKIVSLAIGVVLLLGALGAGAVFADNPPTTPLDFQKGLLGKVAKILGVPEQKEIDAFTQAHTETLDEAVKEGRITQQQADWMKQHMQQAQQGGFGPGFGGGPMLGGAWGGPMGGPFGGLWGSAPSPAPTR